MTQEETPSVPPGEASEKKASPKAIAVLPKPDINRNVSWEDTKVPKIVDTSKTPSGEAGASPKNLESIANLDNGVPGLSSTARPNLSFQEKIKSTADLVRAIRKSNPLESEAEDYILSTIEERDNNESNSSSLLPNVSDEYAKLFKKEEQDDKKKNDDCGGSVLSNKSHRSRALDRNKSPVRKKATMEQTLAALTDQLAGVRNKELKGRGFSIREQQLQQDKLQLLHDGNAGSGETLNRAANIIFRGKNTGACSPPATGAKANWGKLKHSILVKPDEEEIVASNATTPTAKGNWGKLRGAVHMSSVAQNQKKKKSDEETPSEEEERVDPELGFAQSEDDWEADYLDDTYEVGKRSQGSRHKKRLQKAVKQSVVGDFDTFVRQRKGKVLGYFRILIFIVIPALFVSCILFYLAGNPPFGRVDLNASNSTTLVNTDGDVIDPFEPSYSYWILFFAVRQAITFSLAKALQAVVIDFCCINTKLVRLFGTYGSLLVIQSKGWPFIVLFWSVINFLLLCGSKPFVLHWLFFQETLAVFNADNPSGQLPDSDWNRRILVVGIVWSAAAAIKRFFMGLYLGKKTYTNYAEELTKVMNKAVLLCQVAELAKEIHNQADGLTASKRSLPSVENYGITQEEFDGIVRGEHEGICGDSQAVLVETTGIGSRKLSRRARSELVIDPDVVHLHGGSLTNAQRAKVNELLGAWEEPEKELGAEETVSVSAILTFRNSMSYLNNSFMFSIAWGDVSTRDRAIMSSQEVYKRLMSGCPRKSLLSFDALAPAAILPDGSMDIDKMKDLIRLLRPDRDGKLGLLDFVKSVDDVYKEVKLLRASVNNSMKIDKAFENAINVVFYVVLLCVTLSQLGFDPLALFLSLSSIILAFAFMIGSASSKMFEGFLFILVRRPYDIGDRIEISTPESATSINGSSSWFVRDVDLYTTTVVYAATRELATLSNGSLASSRIINMARSPNAVLYIFLKFSVDVAYEKIEIFEEALRKFVQSRPREFAQFLGFRPSTIMQEQGYVEYTVSLQHRESWQNMGVLGNSKADVASFCLELSKKLEMRYTSPPMPVDLSIVNKGGSADADSAIARWQGLSESAGDEIAAMLAKKKEKI